MPKSHLFITGILQFTTKKVTVVSGEVSYFVRPFSLSGYVHGDMVRAKIVKRGDTTRLAEVEVLSRVRYSEELLLGQFFQRKGKLLFVLLSEFGKYESSLPTFGETPEEGTLYTCRFSKDGRIYILQKFANKNDFDKEEKILFFLAGIKTEFPQKILESAQEIKRQSTHANLSRRRDFRDWYTMTIDGSDAKDLDDAISIFRNDHGNFVLAVHIADVAHYVEEGSLLDKEALDRATSIYTPAKVVPMLPEILSNDLCSLHPGTPKLTLSIIIEITPSGQVRKTEMTEGIILSHHRGVYDKIMEYKKNIDAGALGEDQDTRFHQTVLDAFSLYKILTHRRKKEGKILFESTETVFSFREEVGATIPTAVNPRIRNDAHMLIEEFMVLANEEVAKWCHKHEMPFLSRVHGEPGALQTEILTKVLEKGDKKIEPKDIREFMDAIRDSDEVYRYSRLFLPKMAKAVYADKPFRHFGLALDFYAHFTSPIRRYPDLQIHRIIKEKLHGTLSHERKIHYKNILKRVARVCSERERKAEEVSRAFDALYACRYMQDKVGVTFSGRISGVAEFAYFVELENGIEVTIYLPRHTRVSLNALTGSILNTQGKALHTIGEKVKIVVTEVNMDERRILGKRV